MLTTPRALVSMAAGALLLAGCDGGSEADPSTELTVSGTDEFSFEPGAFEVPAGAEVTVELTSEAVEHDFVIEGAADVAEAGDQGHGDHGEDDDHGEGDDAGHGEDHGEVDGEAHREEHGEDDDLHVAHADPGETSAAAFAIHEPGTYEIYCAVAGHRQAGMTATLTVTESA